MDSDKIIKHLDGKIVVEKLEKEADSTGRFRGGDDRGEVAMIISNSVINHIELAEFSRSGIKRGFHFHKEYLERLYLISGTISMSACLASTPSIKKEFTIHAGEIVTIYPMVAHAYLSVEKSIAISMGSGPSPFLDRELYSDLSFAGNISEE